MAIPRGQTKKSRNVLKIATSNIKNYNANKVYLQHLLKKFDIVCIQEHWLYNFEKDNMKEASSNHTCFAKSIDDEDPISPYQRPRGVGGIAIFVPSEWAAFTKHAKDGNQRISVTTIDLPDTKLCVVNCYLPCRGYKSSYSDYDDCLTQLREIVVKFSPSHEIILCGDLNASILKENPDSHDTLLDNFCIEMNLAIPPGSDTGPTFRHSDGRSSRIDFILVHHSNLHLMSEVQHDTALNYMNTSDHIALISSVSCMKPKTKKAKSTAGKTSCKIVWEKADIKQYQKNCSQLLKASNVNNGDSAEVVLQSLHKTLLSAASKCVPTKVSRGYNKKLQQLNPVLARKIKVNKAAFGRLKDALESQSFINNDTMISLTEECKQAKKTLRSHQRQDKASRRNKALHDIMDANTYDQKLFYKLVNEQRASKSGADNILVNGALLTEDEEIRDAWKVYFEQLGIPKNDPSFDQLYLEGVKKDVKMIENILRSSSYKSTQKVSCDEVFAAVRRLNNGKAADGKGIMAEHIKKAGQNILMPLARLFDLIFAEKRVPDDFKKGVTIPIAKKGKDCLLQANHRGITLTNTICKIFENVLLARLRPCIEAKYSCLQRGFTSNTTSLSAALLVSELMNDAKDSGKDLFLASLDASKAFDVVSHVSLLRRLHLLDIPPEFWTIIQHLYDDARCQVKSRGSLSEPFTLHQGVHQGRVTSTDLYKCYIDPILHRLEEKKLGARIGPYYVGAPTCADDLVLATHDPLQLQEMLNEVVIFSNRERYALHPQKSMVLPICKKSQINYWHEFSPWTMNGTAVQVSNLVQHLGIERRSIASNKESVNTRIQVGRRATYALMGAGLHGLNGVNPKTAWKLLSTFVEPRYAYGLEILGLTATDKKLLDAYQKKTIKQIQHLPDRASNAAVYLLLGALPISAKIELNQLTLFRMVIAKDSIEAKIAERQLAMKSSKSKSWFIEVNKLLSKYNLPSAHDLLVVPPSKLQWKNTVHAAVYNYWNDALRAEAEQKVSLKYLNIDNCRLGTIHQVWSTVHPHQRDVSRATIKARLLTGCYTLQANKAKFNQNKIDPTCLLCKEDPETREHFIACCSRTNHIREPFLSCMKVTAEKLYPGSWEHISSTSHLLTQFILDSTHFQAYPNLCLPCEPTTRMLVYKLHLMRATLMENCMD